MSCDYNLKINLPIEIIIEWGIFFTGRIHPIESEILYKHFIKNPGNLILLGGYRDGFLAMICAKVFSNYQFHIVEPVKEYIDNINYNLKINDINNVKIHNCAIGSYDGYTDLEIKESETHLKQTGFQKNDFELKKYKINKLSSLLTNEKIENIKYLIIDIENAEALAIKDAVNFGINFILFETYDLSMNNYKILMDYENKGYQFYEIDKKNKSLLKKIKDYDQFKNSEFFNYILINKE